MAAKPAFAGKNNGPFDALQTAVEGTLEPRVFGMQWIELEEFSL